MLNTEEFNVDKISNTGLMPYADQLTQLDDRFENYVFSKSPDMPDQKEAVEVWNEIKPPVTIDTESLSRNAIYNLDAIPFRTRLENANMPFSDNVIYTAADISASTSSDELMNNVLANIYQLGTLSTAILVQTAYLKKLPQQVFDSFSDDTQKFIQDEIKSTEPFELIIYPENELNEGMRLIDEIQKNQETISSSIVLHPIAKNLTILFVNEENISGMSVKQIASRLNELSKLKKLVDKVDVKSLVTSPEVDERSDGSHQNSREKSELSRHERVKIAKIQKLSSVKQITTIISRMIKKHGSKQHTQNVTKKVSKTYNKPNRREPENDFKPGKSHRRIYRPDIHLYLDTSGSMSIDQYKQGIMAAINIAKSLKTNIYISSFSDQLVEPILLDKIKQQSNAVLLKRALKVPVISGGTDFENVYNDIDERSRSAIKSGRAPEYAIIMSDMCCRFSPGYQVSNGSKKALHLVVDDYFDEEMLDDFKTAAFNIGITRIDSLMYKL